jgi:hypothetical protein
MPIILAKPRLMRWSGNAISDHNRSELQISPERIEKKQRMADGTMRKYVVADKRTFTVSWRDLPHSASFTVDGFWGADEMSAFYLATFGEFDLEITYGDTSTETFSVIFSDFNSGISKRGAFDFWDVSVTMEQV